MVDLINDLRWRGLIHQTTDDTEIPKLLSTPQVVYAGFDPTADSLHVGSLLGVMTLRRFQAAGHRPIVLVGGATGMIGDPSGKSEERNLLSIEALQANIAGMQSQLRRFLEFSVVTNAAILVNNYDWMSRFSYIEFLRDVGKMSPVNVMLAKESVKARLERSNSGMSYTEFSYMLLQAYDFLHLYDQYGCLVQLGGSDQWGNITAGIDLTRRMRQVQLYGITWPLLTKSDGTKMGKTESGTVWLAADRTSPYQFYQYWFNVADEDAGRCLRLLTELPHDELEHLDATRQSQPERRESQTRLADWLTQLVHGLEGVESARKAKAIFFGEEIEDQNAGQLVEIFADVPSKSLPRTRLEGEGLMLTDALVEAGLAKSKAEARRAIEQGGGYVNNRRIEQWDFRLTSNHLIGGTVIVLRRGKKNYGLLRIE